MSATATTRQLRAVAVAAASFGLGMGGHLQAGGHATAPAAIALAAGFCAVSGWSYSRRRISGGGLLGVLVANQVVVHLALTIGSVQSPVPGGLATDCTTHGTSPAAAAVTAAGASTEGAVAMAMPLLPDRWMLLAHAVATVLTAGVLLAVQTLCLGLGAVARWLARVVRAAFGTPLLLPDTVRAAWTQPATWTSRAVGARPGRGPPEPLLS